MVGAALLLAGLPAVFAMLAAPMRAGLPAVAATPLGSGSGSPLAVTGAPGASAGAVVSAVVISEFRTRGPRGGSDEFVELYNRSAGPVDVSGWTLNASNAAGATQRRLTFSAGTVLQPGQYFLATNRNGYSGGVPGDQTYAAGIGDDGGIGLVLPDGTVVDQVGMSVGSAYQEGGVLRPLTTSFDQSYERRPGGAAGNAQDTDDNARDFLLNPCSSTPQNLSSPSVAPVAHPPAPGPAAETILPIGVVQGVVGDGDDGDTHRSPYAPPCGNTEGETVMVQGVIHQRTLTRARSGAPLHGLFVQNTAATADADPNTSDGIFVFLGGADTLEQVGGGRYAPVVGDEVVLRGPVVEFDRLTQLARPAVMRVVRQGVALDAEVPAFEADPPTDYAAARRYWERSEGMRGRIPEVSVVVGGRHPSSNTADSEVWVVRGDSAVAQRPDLYARRVFRDPHPLDNVDGDQLFDDGNGYRILLGSLGIRAATGDKDALVAPARTFDSLASARTGGVSYVGGQYWVQVDEQLALAPGADPAQNAPPREPDRAREYSIATYNVENLYDFRDDPDDNCDFVGNAGCSNAINYVPDSDATYQARLRALAAQIVDDLQAPDILLLQEVEDQDICGVVAGALVCGAVGQGDGQPDTVQELALAIAARSELVYRAASDRDGADPRGIVQAFLYRADRVELLGASAADPLLGSSPEVEYAGVGDPKNAHVQNPKALNAWPPGVEPGRPETRVFPRGPQVALFRVWRDGVGLGPHVDLYAIDNHFSANPTLNPARRREQAAYNAALVATLRRADPDARVVVGGDLNVYPRPDDPFPPPAEPSDQLGPLYDTGLAHLWERLVAIAPASAYSYVYEGQAQTLDHLFVSPALLAGLVEVRAAHLNADWPKPEPGDPPPAENAPPRAASDHDPLVARFAFPAP